MLLCMTCEFQIVLGSSGKHVQKMDFKADISGLSHLVGVKHSIVFNPRVF